MRAGARRRASCLVWFWLVRSYGTGDPEWVRAQKAGGGGDERGAAAGAGLGGRLPFVPQGPWAWTTSPGPDLRRADDTWQPGTSGARPGGVSQEVEEGGGEAARTPLRDTGGAGRGRARSGARGAQWSLPGGPGTGGPLPGPPALTPGVHRRAGCGLQGTVRCQHQRARSTVSLRFWPPPGASGTEGERREAGAAEGPAPSAGAGRGSGDGRSGPCPDVGPEAHEGGHMGEEECCPTCLEGTAASLGTGGCGVAGGWLHQC